MFQKYPTNISMYSYPPIQDTKSWFLLKVGYRFKKKNLFWTLYPGLENNDALKFRSSFFPTVLIYVAMLKNFRNSISMYGCSPIQGTRF